MIEEKDKEIYQLWWEYLKRSERYREFCQWWNQGSNNPLPDNLKQYHQPMWNTYIQFGDVHNELFDEWWDGELENPLPCPYHPYYPGLGKNMVDYRSVIEKDIYKIQRRFKKEQGREPNVKELIDNLKSYMTSWDKERLYLLIEIQDASNSEIVKEFHDLLADRKKDPPVKEASRSVKGMKGISTIKKKPSTTEELERYLRTYDYRKTTSDYNEIAKTLWAVEEDEDDYSDDTIRIIKRDLRKAKKIISNVEYGYFPGEF